MAMEIRQLRLGLEPAPDRPIETLNPPACWLKWFKEARVLTVNELRAVTTDILLDRPTFPKGAIDWAIMRLDREGLSHALLRTRDRTVPNPKGNPTVLRKWREAQKPPQ